MKLHLFNQKYSKTVILWTYYYLWLFLYIKKLTYYRYSQLYYYHKLYLLMIFIRLELTWTNKEKLFRLTNINKNLLQNNIVTNVFLIVS